MSDHADDGRTASYAELVSALSGARHDPASARFDRELAAAEAAGTVDPAVARTLRWWQRESIRAVEDHLVGVLPVVLARLEASERDAADTIAASAVSWATATGSERTYPNRGAPPPAPRGPGPHDEGGPGGGVQELPSRPPGSGPAGAQRTPEQPGGDPAPHLRPVDRTGAHGTPQPGLQTGFAPARTGDEQHAPPPVAHDSVEGGAPRRRLLVGGLTVLPDDDSTRTRHDGVSGASG